MTRTNAQGGSYVFRTTGSDNWSGKSAMTEARRRQIHGKLLPMDRPLKDEGTGYDNLSIWDEQPRFFTGVAWMLCALVAAGVLWVMVP